MRFCRLTMLAASLALAGFVNAQPAASASSPAITNDAVCAAPTLERATCFARIVRSGGLPVRPNVAQRSAMSVAVSSVSGLRPSDLRSAYALPSATAGAGITVGIIDAYDDVTVTPDLATYRAQFGLPVCGSGCFAKLNQSGTAGPYPAANSGWSEEIALDVEMVSAVCPLCHIALVEANSNSFDDLFASVQTAVGAGATVISMSFGSGEWGSETGYDSTYLSAASHPDLAGVTLTASAGDGGYGVAYPAASPYVTAVGGTSLIRDGSARGWHETAWSGSGSGCSAYEPKPAWQRDTGCAHRTVSDISALADPNTGVAVYAGAAGGWAIFGGTSVASPIVAATYALTGPLTGSAPAAHLYSTNAAHFDVTSGSNGSCAQTYLCTAAAGYDGPTGLGTPDGLFSATVSSSSGSSSGPPAVGGSSSPLPFASLYSANAYGQVGSFAGSSVTPSATWPGWQIARDVAGGPGGGGYVLDAFGGLHPYGGAPGVRPSGYWPGWDIARAIAVGPSGHSGYVLDGFGGLHPFGGAPAVAGVAYWRGWDIARDVVLRSDGTSGYVLDAFGGLHPFGGAPAVRVSGYWPGWQIARRAALNPDGAGGYVLDGFGGLHPFGNAVSVRGEAYWPGWNIARDVVVLPGQPGAGYTLDGFGGIHPFGGAPSVRGGTYIAADLARGLTIS